MRIRFAALLLLAASACSTPGSRQPPEAGPAPPLAQVALTEWQAWGGIVLEGWPEGRPADTAATPDRFDRLIGYWREVPGNEGVARRLETQRASLRAALSGQGMAELAAADTAALPAPTAPPVEDIGLYAYPAWSAAFVSAMARRAGIPESDLPSEAAHAFYIDAVLWRAAADPQGARFLPHDPAERTPRPGDLLCADRSARPLEHWTMRLLETGRSRPMHCDVVVRTAPEVVEAVGGNVKDVVALRRLPADSQGRVLPAPPGQARLLLLLAARGGG